MATGWKDKQVGPGKRVAVVIGRFSPFHNGHLQLIEAAARQSDYLVMVFGSARQARTFKAPWSDNDRVAMINQVLTARFGDKMQIRFAGVADHHNDYAWEKEVVNKVISSASLEAGDNVTIFGYEKDSSSYYLKMFDRVYDGVHWYFQPVEAVDSLNATDIRHLLFTSEKDGLEQCATSLPEPVFNYLSKNWLGSPDFKTMQREYLFMQKYKKQFEGLKYPPTFTTADAVVVADRSVLLVKRKEMPGQNLWSLPGGFVGQDERMIQAATRVALQKGGIRVNEGQVVNHCFMDNPGRSLRGRTITHAFLFELPRAEPPQTNKGEWYPISNIALLEEQMYEDHLQIIERLCFSD